MLTCFALGLCLLDPELWPCCIQTALDGRARVFQVPLTADKETNLIWPDQSPACPDHKYSKAQLLQQFFDGRKEQPLPSRESQGVFVLLQGLGSLGAGQTQSCNQLKWRTGFWAPRGCLSDSALAAEFYDGSQVSLEGRHFMPPVHI